MRQLAVPQPVPAGLVAGLTRTIGRGWDTAWRGELLLNARPFDRTFLDRPAVLQGLAGGQRRAADDLRRVRAGWATPDPVRFPAGGFAAAAQLTDVHPAAGCRSCGPWAPAWGWHWTVEGARALPLVVPAPHRPGLLPVPEHVLIVVAELSAA